MQCCYVVIAAVASAAHGRSQLINIANGGTGGRACISVNGCRSERMGVFHAGQYAFAHAHVTMTLVRHVVGLRAMCGWCPACHHQCDAIIWTKAQIGGPEINMMAYLDKGHNPATEWWTHLGERDGCFYADPGIGFRNECSATTRVT